MPESMTDNEPTPAPATLTQRMDDLIETALDPYAYRTREFRTAMRDCLIEARAALSRFPAPARSPADELHAETERLDFLLARISGKELRRIGILYAGNCERADIDAAIPKSLAAREGAHQPHDYDLRDELRKALNEAESVRGALPAVAPVLDGESK